MIEMASDPVVDTREGPVIGRALGNGVACFLGVPYGGPTDGVQRFRAPEPAPARTEPLDASRYGPACPQGADAMRDDDPASTNGLGLSFSENCLSLNIWTPACDGKKRPVLVWMHGGAFRFGSGAHPITEGDQLAAYGDAVVVTLNHRLGVFGHLYLDELCGAEFAGSGMAGQLDLVLALEWVRDNIESFGGDPDCVTVFGESGGGRKICTLMAMPSAKGLFHRAIVQSGAHVHGIPRALAHRVAERFLAWLGIAPSDVAKLQSMPDSELFSAGERFFDEVDDPEIPKGAAGRWLFSPVIDGRALPHGPWDAAPEVSRDVPLLIGSNKDEAAYFLFRDPKFETLSEAELHERVTRVLGERAGPIIAAHRAARPDETPWDIFVTIASEDRRLLSIEIADKKAAQGGAPAYLYFMTWETDHERFRSAHTLEIPFVFRTTDRTVLAGTRPDREALRDHLSDAWLAFARTGSPTTPHAPDWPAFDAGTRATMILDTPPRVEQDPWKAERLAWGAEPVSMPWQQASFVSMAPAAPSRGFMAAHAAPED